MLQAQNFRLEDLRLPEFTVPSHEPSNGSETPLSRQNTDLTLRPEDASSALPYHRLTEDDRKSSTFKSTRATNSLSRAFEAIKFRNPRILSGLKVKKELHVPRQTALSTIQGTPSLRSLAISSYNSNASTIIATPTSSHTSYETVGPERRAGALTIPKDSPKIYRVKKRIYLGKLRDCHVPATMEEEWDNSLQDRLVKDLQQVLELQRPPLSSKEGIFDPMLCMVGEVEGQASVIQLRPTIWIRCGSKRCQKAIQSAVKSLTYLEIFCQGKVQVHLGAPLLACRTEDRSDIVGETLPATQLRVLMPETVSPYGCSASGMRISYRHPNDRSMEIMWTVGGLLEIGGVTYGLTTGHSFFFDSYESDSSSESDFSSEDSDSSDGSSLSGSGNSLSNQASARVQTRDPRVSFSSSRWKLASLFALDYIGRKSISTPYPAPVPNECDFALIEVDQPESSLHNCYEAPGADGGPVIIDSIGGELASGDVSIVCSPNDVRPGYLLSGQAYLINGKSAVRTRRIQTNVPFETGLSGTWVVRGTTVIGMIVAVYEKEPYIHMLEMRQVVHDIGKVDVGKVELPKSAICIRRRGRAEGVSETNATPTTPNIANYPTAQWNPTIERLEIDAERRQPDFLPNGPCLHPRLRRSDFWGLVVAFCLANMALGFDMGTGPFIAPLVSDSFLSVTHIGLYGSIRFLSAALSCSIFRNLVPLSPSRWTYTAFLVLWLMGGILSAFAHTSILFLVGTAISGMASPWVKSSAHRIVEEATSEPEAITSLLSMVRGLFEVIGTLLGASLADRFGWQPCFYTSVCIGIVALGLFVIFSCRFSGQEIRLQLSISALREYDMPGTLLFVTSSACMIIGLQLGASTDWLSITVILWLVAFGLFSLTLTIIRLTVGTEFTTRFNSPVRAAMFLSSFWTACTTAYIYFMIIWLQSVKGKDALNSALMFLPVTLSSFFIPGICDTILQTGPYHSARYTMGQLTIAFALVVLGTGLSTTFSPDTSGQRWFGYQIIIALGIGLGNRRVRNSVKASVLTQEMPSQLLAEEMSSAKVFLHFFESMGSGFGIFVAHIIFISLLTGKKRGVPELATLFEDGLIGFRTSTSPETLDTLLRLVSNALVTIPYISVAVGSVPILTVLCQALLKALRPFMDN